jgi:hypothetical protein
MLDDETRTIRPGHEVVKALEDGTFLELMHETLAPDGWDSPTDHGFTWTPGTTQHTVEIHRRPHETKEGVEVQVCRSTFLLCTDVEDIGNGISRAHAINQLSIGGCAYFNVDEGRLYFTSSVVLDPSMWFEAFLLWWTVPRLVGILERFAPHLATDCRGRLPQLPHPTRGVRETPDQLVREAHFPTLQPEAAIGNWWAPNEIKRFRNALRRFANDSFGPDVAALIEDRQPDANLTSAENIFIDLRVHHHQDEWFDLTVREGRHPNFGYGTEISIATPYVFGEDLGLEDTPKTTMDGMEAVNALNMIHSNLPIAQFGMGAWTTWRSQIVYETFIYPEAVSILQAHSRGFAGDVLALLAISCVERLRDFMTALDMLSTTIGPFTYLDSGEPSRWDGVGRNAQLHPLFGPDDDVYRELFNTQRMNCVIEPVELGVGALELQTQVTLASMGVFHPQRPIVGSLEVAIQYRIGVAALIEKIRQPSGTSVRVHAVIDRDGFNDLDSLIEQVIPRLQWESFDWWNAPDCDDERFDAMREGLRRFAERQPETDWGIVAMRLATAHDPWARINSRKYSGSPPPADVDPIELWIDVITSAQNINMHTAYLRSAWEGATKHLAAARSGEPVDDSIVRTLTSIVRTRLGTD